MSPRGKALVSEYLPGDVASYQVLVLPSGRCRLLHLDPVGPADTRWVHTIDPGSYL